jgi:hypothetical protein
MKNEEAKRRPRGVTILAVFYALAVPSVFFFGMLFFVLWFGVGAESNGPLSFWGMLFVYSIQIAIIVFPIALAIVAFGLWLGRKWARVGTVALSGANLVCVCFVYGYLFRGSLNELYSIVFPLDILIQLAIIYYMFTPIAKSYLR